MFCLCLMSLWALVVSVMVVVGDVVGVVDGAGVGE